MDTAPGGCAIAAFERRCAERGGYVACALRAVDVSTVSVHTHTYSYCKAPVGDNQQLRSPKSGDGDPPK
ncbi:hypothetical protein E4U40_002389 [Claviceps sp. LM458 group G5]|nr:hypothetical protein E4U40_002389 [Claviceps sp. LM458 group G5]